MENINAGRGLFGTYSRLSNMGERAVPRPNLNRGRAESPETINLEDEHVVTKSSSRLSATWLKNCIFSEITETSTKVIMTMDKIDKKQEESEKLLADLRSNLEAIKSTVQNYDSLVEQNSAEMARGFPYHGQQDKGKDKLDAQTGNAYLNFLIKDLDVYTSKLEENVVAVRSHHELNRNHLKSIESCLEKAERELKPCIEEEKQREATPGCGIRGANEESGHSSRISSSATNSPMNDSEKRSQATQGNEESLNTPKRRKTDGKDGQGCSTPTSANQTPRSQTESLRSARTSADYQRESGKRAESGSGNRSQNVSNAGANEAEAGEDDSQGSQESQSMLGTVDKMAGKVAGIREKLNNFEVIICESKLVLSSFNRHLESLGTAVKDELTKREEKEKEERNTGTDVPPSSSQQFQLPAYGLFSSILPATGSRTSNNSYYDTRSEVAQRAIQRVIGPLTPEQLTAFLDNIKNKKNSMSYVRQTTADVESLKQQLVWVKELLDESYKEFMNCPGNRSVDFDRRLQQRLATLISTIESSCDYQAARNAQNFQ